MIAVVIGAVVVVIALLLVVFLGRGGPRHESGVVNFRRHIDALSPEARREVMDRVRPPQDDDDRPGS